MSEQNKARWKELAEQASREKDPLKSLELTRQLSRILDEEEDRLNPRRTHSAA